MPLVFALLWTLGLGLAAPPAAAAAGAQASDADESFRLPNYVVGGDAFFIRTPMQFDLLAYRPRVRLELGWAHQIDTRPHGFELAGSALLDRGKRHVLAPDAFSKSDPCQPAPCKGGSVAGGLARAGYRYAPVFHKKPWLQPLLHASVVGGAWVQHARVQAQRAWTAQLGLELGAGLRIFLTERIGLGADLDLQLDLLLPEDRWRRPIFALGLGAFALSLEIRG